eukprot:6155919-Pleurochrysis_carterae.AAC.5
MHAPRPTYARPHLLSMYPRTRLRCTHAHRPARLALLARPYLQIRLARVSLLCSSHADDFCRVSVRGDGVQADLRRGLRLVSARVLALVVHGHRPRDGRFARLCRRLR